MAYENFLIREMTGEYQSGDTNCSDCGQVICACESLAEWLTERDAEVCSTGSGEDVCVFPALPEPTPCKSFPKESDPGHIKCEHGGNWLSLNDEWVEMQPCEINYKHFGSESEPYTHEEAEQRREWLCEAYLDIGHLNT